MGAVPAWTPASVAAGCEGEDELDAFPLPAEARGEELREVAAAAGDGEDGQADAESQETALAVLDPEPLASAGSDADGAGAAGPEPLAAGVDDVGDDPEGAIRRFHQEIGLVPATTAVEPVVAAPVEVEAGAGGGGGIRAGRGGPAAAGAGGGRRRPVIVDHPMTIFEHLDELRTRLMWAALAFVLGTAATFPFMSQIIHFAVNGNHVVAIHPLENIYAGLRVVVLGGLILGSPVILYQIIAYVLPALTGGERRMLYTYLPAALVLFLLGVLFGLTVFEPLAIKMSQAFLPWVKQTPTLSNYINYLIGYSLPFGALFEFPVVVSIVVRLGLLTPQALVANRRWAAMGCLVVAVMFAPPLDFIVTPSIIFIPLYGLYELSIVIARRAYRQRLQAMADEERRENGGE